MKNLKKGLLVFATLLLVCGCGEIPKTKDGKEAIVTFEKGDTKHDISADELYSLLKTKYGFDEVLQMVDTYILESEFESYKETAQDYAKSYLDGILKNYESEEQFLSALQQNTGYNSIDEYKNYIYLSYMQSHSIEEYAKSLVTEKQINSYYEDKAKENIEVYHILITPDVTDDMKDSEKTKAETKAKKEAKALIDEINASNDKVETFKNLAKKSSDDTATKDKGGSLGYINEFTLGTEYDELVKAAYSLKDGEVYASVVTTELGYHVVMRTATKDKSKLEDLKEDITTKLSQEIAAADSNFTITAMKHYRDLYNLKIVDTDLEKSYRNYMNELQVQANQQANQTTEQ